MPTTEEYRGACVCGITLVVRVEFPTQEVADRAMANRREGFDSDCPSCGWREAIAMKLVTEPRLSPT